MDLTATDKKSSILWPERKDVFGIPVTPTNYKEATECITAAAVKKVSACVDCMAVHSLISAIKNPAYGKMIREKFDMVCPDGQPVRWTLNKFHNSGLKDRVYGPNLTLHVLDRAHAQNIPVFFYGSKPEVLEKLRKNLLERYPNLSIAGMESPPFRELSPREYSQAAERINQSGARILFIGLGCPKQELWAGRQKNAIHMPMLCVGAAFDFHAGVLPQAPALMQNLGLEWAYRLYKEPRRLWRRYLYCNICFVKKFLQSSLKGYRI
ncbi:WecB/TagA/CpsF family glycosyl transferase [Chitinispirillum alkaliphilum]|nr:WecB/TagA/CpsF family glycosyl transferase [Chitinispirillum alkaliphilum]